MYLNNLKITSWQQFENIEINLDNKLTIITGANGSGKTTLLNILSKHSGWNITSLATPKQDISTKVIRYFSRFFLKEDKGNEQLIGQIKYSTGFTAGLLVPESNQAQYLINIQGMKGIKCFYVPSHRSLYKYQKVQNIPISKKNKEQAFAEVSQSTKNRYQAGGVYSENNSFLMKNTLIGWAIQGYGNEALVPDIELISNYEGFKTILKKVLPSSLGFETFEIRDMEIVFICNGGDDEFLLETASGGISAIIDIAWQIYMFPNNKDEVFTIIIDEIENHLHPMMQRSILPNLMDAFPNANFIVSTHSPLIVGSVKNSTTYALKYNENKKIESYRLNFEDQIKSATEILDEVLGVSFTMPIWVEDTLEKTISKYTNKEMTEKDFIFLRKELKEIGLEKLMPQAIINLLGAKND